MIIRSRGSCCAGRQRAPELRSTTHSQSSWVCDSEAVEALIEEPRMMGDSEYGDPRNAVHPRRPAGGVVETSPPTIQVT